MKHSIRLLWALVVVATAAKAQRAGDAPPALVWNSVRGNCPAKLDWASLRGKVVVVSLSHDDSFPSDFDEWRQAAKLFEGDPVLFIRIAGGSEFLLDQALRQGGYQGCVLFDAKAQNQKNFDLPVYFGRTVVVDQLGVIVGYARGSDDVEEAVRAVLDQRPATGLAATPPQVRPFDPTAGIDKTSFGVHITPAPEGEFRVLGGGGGGTYVTRNQPLKFIILDLWDMPLSRILFPENLGEGYYDVVANMPWVDHDAVLQSTRQAVEQEFGLVIEKETRTEKAYRLSAGGGSSRQLRPARKDERRMVGGGESSIVGTAQSMEEMAHVFEGLLHTPVIDGTNLKEKYDYSASSKLSGEDSAFDLARQLGLELTDASAPIEVLVVRKIQ